MPSPTSLLSNAVAPIPLGTLTSLSTSSSPPPSTTSLIPPYGTGPATYYASILHRNPYVTTYTITCVPASGSTASPNSDPCQTAIYGDAPLTFYQGASAWGVVRKQPMYSQPANFEYSTICAPATTAYSPSAAEAMTMLTLGTQTCNAIPMPTAMACEIDFENREGSGRATDVRAMCEMGMRVQEVLMVESLPTSTSAEMAMPTLTSNPRLSSFTDIGSSPTKAGPVTTVTLLKQPGVSAGRGKEIGRVSVGVLLGVMVLVGWGEGTCCLNGSDREYF
ncbi:hypothetical protein CC80DRAFT_542569 [Byssothecium circinans]|uniref:Uncharacterized protein n=1 Tax=Byssothecium circinans TaxID=147558 RepID=A0A6A5UBI1_9PLEO|nr:hypothetical protein CC80DRAFT_542569 [Byssothecium circinans]